MQGRAGGEAVTTRDSIRGKRNESSAAIVGLVGGSVLRFEGIARLFTAIETCCVVDLFKRHGATEFAHVSKMLGLDNTSRSMGRSRVRGVHSGRSMTECRHNVQTSTIRVRARCFSSAGKAAFALPSVGRLRSARSPGLSVEEISENI